MGFKSVPFGRVGAKNDGWFGVSIICGNEQSGRKVFVCPSVRLSVFLSLCLLFFLSFLLRSLPAKQHTDSNATTMTLFTTIAHVSSCCLHVYCTVFLVEGFCVLVGSSHSCVRDLCWCGSVAVRREREEREGRGCVRDRGREEVSRACGISRCLFSMLQISSISWSIMFPAVFNEVWNFHGDHASAMLRCSVMARIGPNLQHVQRKSPNQILWLQVVCTALMVMDAVSFTSRFI